MKENSVKEQQPFFQLVNLCMLILRLPLYDLALLRVRVYKRHVWLTFRANGRWLVGILLLRVDSTFFSGSCVLSLSLSSFLPFSSVSAGFREGPAVTIAAMNIKEKQITSALNLMRRMPPAQIENNLSGLLTLIPEDTDELLQRIDQPLQVRKDPKTGKSFVLCDYNRDGDSYRSVAMALSIHCQPTQPLSASSCPHQISC